MANAGLPVSRILCCLPSASSLAWGPANPIKTPVKVWKDQALGTAMVMAKLMNDSILPKKQLDEQVQLQLPPCQRFPFIPPCQRFPRKWQGGACSARSLTSGRFSGTFCHAMISSGA